MNQDKKALMITPQVMTQTHISKLPNLKETDKQKPHHLPILYTAKTKKEDLKTFFPDKQK